MKRKLNSKGFTLVELMVASTILLIVLALAYQTLAYFTGTHNRTEKKWIVERDVKQVMSTRSEERRVGKEC